MVKSDILLDDEGIEMLPADGPIVVNAGPDETPGIRLVPATASLRLGGGTSEAYNDGATFGNIQLDSKEGDPRIVLSTGDIAPPDEEENAVFIFSDGLDEYGQVWLGEVGKSFSESTVRLDARSSQITLGSSTGTGDLLMYKEGLVETLYFTGHDSTLRIGGTDVDEENGVSGTLKLKNAGSEETATLDAGPQNDDGASLTLADHTGTTTATVDGGTGSLTLGADSENGTLSLNDGHQMQVDLDAADGVASLRHHESDKRNLGLELAPKKGLFSIVDANGDPVFQVNADGVVTFGSGGGKVGLDLDPENGLFSVVDEDGDPVFQVDTQAKTVNTAKGYSRGTIGSGGG